MASPIIRIEHLGKRYTIRHEAHRNGQYRRLSEVLAEAAMRPFRKAPQSGPSASEDLWALRDVSFDVHQGEVVGIIGRNGAGKSTLLKVLSRITEPTEGRVRLRGRVASLLEVGTGFHPELTGRENVFLNGAILGMSRAEIRRKFDEIVAFAEVERFMDTPVKRYSSGMYVRLAFAVAAHLEPEILIVDEVLAVGDAEFQRKCIGRMQRVAGHGRTVLFVSHNLNAVRSLCARAVWLDAGSVVMAGLTDEVADAYGSGQGEDHRTVFLPEHKGPDDRIGSKRIRFLGMRIVGDCDRALTNGDRVCVEAVVQVDEPCEYTMCVPVFRMGEIAFFANSYHVAEAFQIPAPGVYTFRMVIPPDLLNPGQHELSLYIADKGGHEQYIRLTKALRFAIEDDGRRRGKRFHGQWPGPVCPLLDAKAVRLPCRPPWASPK